MGAVWGRNARECFFKDTSNSGHHLAFKAASRWLKRGAYNLRCPLLCILPAHSLPNMHHALRSVELAPDICYFPGCNATDLEDRPWLGKRRQRGAQRGAWRCPPAPHINNFFFFERMKVAQKGGPEAGDSQKVRWELHVGGMPAYRVATSLGREIRLSLTSKLCSSLRSVRRQTGGLQLPSRRRLLDCIQMAAPENCIPKQAPILSQWALRRSIAALVLLSL